MLDKRTKLVALIALAIGSSCALANPSGPQVVQGTATFSQPNANTLNVTNSHNAIINWQKFSIGAGQTTNFIQPSRHSAVLNRVISNNPSRILGNLNSNGRVFLVNQHGLMIGAGAQINTAGFYGSTLNITNEDFLNGNLKFDGGGFGGIQNHGYIHAGPGGNVVLVAPDIENGGVIEVDDGNVILAAGESIRITSLNDAAIEFDVQAPDNSIVNLGQIIAKQGAARLFAGNLKHSGAINATGIRRNADGSISLVAQQDIEIAAGASLDADGADGGDVRVQSLQGDVVIAGQVSALGEDGAGGRIEITGERVGLFGEAVVDASGRTGGGEVLVGGDFQGKGEVRTARQTQVGPHAAIRADATDSGDGGKVIVWADESTIFSGEASATGGADSGDGGFIEVSGKNRLDFSGMTDASADNGESGSVLFDPRNLTVQIAGGATAPPELADALYDFIEPDSAVDSIIAPVAITNITDTGTAIELNANNNITINDDILTNEGGAGGDITLRAGNSIFINADILTDRGKLTLIANEFAGQGVIDSDRGPGAAEIRMADGVTIDTRDRVSPAFAGNLEVIMQLGNDKTNAGTGDITLATVFANDVLIRHNGRGADNSILSTLTGSITANSVFIDHDDLGGGAGGNRSIGTLGLPLNLVSDFIAAHIHGSSTSGIYIDAVPILQPDVTVGGTCYGDGDGGVNCGFGHVIRGLDTDFGDLVLNANGSGLIVIEPIDIQGQADISAVFDIATDPDNKGNPLAVRAGTLNLTSSAGNILVNGGIGLSSTLESVSNNLNINAVDLVLTEGSGDGDALVIVDNGRGALFLNGAPCATCNPLAFDPRGNGSPDSGVIAANFPVAVNWVGIGGGGDGINWTDPLNWNTGNLPLGNANVTINDVSAITVTLASGNHDVLSLNMPGDDSLAITGTLLDIANASTINTDLTISGPTAALNVDGPLTINGALNLGQGTLSGGGDVTVNGITRWSPPAGAAAQNFSLTGTGFLFASGGFELDASLDNDSLTLDKLLTIGAVFNPWNDAGAGGSSIVGSGGIVNNGGINANNGAQLDVGVSVINNGGISKDSGGGLLLISGLLTMNPGSSLYVAEGTSVSLGGATLFLANVAELGGAGTFIGDVISSGGLIDVETSLGGTGTLTINGNLTLDIASTLAFDLAGTVQSTSHDFLDVTGSANLDGTVALFWENGFIATNGNTFDLLRSGTGFSGAFDTVIDPAGVTDSSLSAIISGPPDIFQYVAGVVSPNVILWNVNASGVWDDVANWFWPGGPDRVPTSTDYVVIDQDDRAIVVTVDNAVTILGMQSQNNITVNGTGSLTMNDDLLFTGDNLVLDSATTSLTMNGIATVAGQMDWNSGVIDGSGSIDIYRVGVLNINAGAGNLDNAIFVNGVQSSTWSGGASGGIGTITVNGLLDISGSLISSIPLTNNVGGSVSKSGPGTTTLTGTVVNNGILEVRTGTLELQASAAHAGTFDIAAGATLTLSGGSTHFLNGGLWGGGTLDTLGAASVDAAGVIEPGGPGAIGILNVNGDLIVSGLVQTEIAAGGGAPTAGIDYDQLAIGGQANLTGNLGLVSFAGYTPADGDTFMPVLYVSRTANTFANIFPIGTEVITPTYNANDLTLVIGVPQTTTWIGVVDNLWNTPGNWDNGVPGSTDTAVVPFGSAFNISIAAAASTGTLSLASDAVITQAANLTIEGSSTLSGDYNLTGGIFDIVTSAQFDGNLSVSGGTLTGAGSILVNGNFDWTGGTLSGTGLLTTAGTGTINQLAGLTLSRNWTNSGSLTWQNGNILVNSARTFTNNGNFTANAFNTFTLNSGAERFINNSNLIVNNDFSFNGGGAFDNSGTVTLVSVSTLGIATGSGAEAGNWDIGDGTVAITGGARTLNDGFSATSLTGFLNVSGGTLTVATSSPLALPAALTFNVSGGALTGSGDLVVGGPFNWTGGVISGTGLLTTNGSSTLNQAGGLTLSRSWTNNGTVNWNNGNVLVNSLRTFTNAATGIFNANAAATFTISSGSETFDNQNVININSNTTFNGGGSLDNAVSGSIVVAGSATLNMATGTSSDSGTWTIGAGAIDITGGSRTLNDGFSVTSTTGSLSVSGGVLEVNTSAPLTLPASLAFNLSGGALTGSGDLAVDGAFSWTGGSLTGPGLLTTNATSTLNQPGGLAISRNWLNLGTLNWQAGNIQINSLRTFTNAGSGVVNANAAGTFILTSASETFDNQGTINVNTDTSFGGGGALNNSGSLVVASATTLSLGNGSGSDTGTWDIGLGEINLIVGTRTLNDGFSATASGGILSISGGTLDVNTLSPLTLPAGLALDMLAGTLTGSGDLAVDGSFDWTGGSIQGIGLLTTNGAVTLNQAGGLTLGRNWTANGAVTWIAGTFSLNSAATFVSNASFDANAAGALINLNSGTLFDNRGNFTLNGDITIGGSNLFEHNGGQFDLNGFTVTAAAGLRTNAGELVGSGTVAGNLINNGATIHPGGIDTVGTMNITGDLINTTGTILIEIANDVVAAGTSYDLVAVTGQADLNDTLTLLVIGGYTALNNDVLSPITYGATLGGTFTTINPTGIETVTPTYGANALDLLLSLAGGITWVGGPSGIWSVPANWSGNAVPTLGDDVAIGAADVTITTVPAFANTITLAGSGSLTLQDNSLEIDNDSTLTGLLTINGGTLLVEGMTLTLGGGLDWNGGGSSISGGATGGTLVNGGGSTITASSGLTILDNVTLNNNGSLVNAQVVVNDFRMANGALINNAGTFDIQNDVGVFDNGGGGSITNTGLITKSGGAGTSSFAAGIAVDNVGGTVSAVGTALNLDGGGSHSGAGTFTGPVNFNGGTFTIADASTVTGNFNVTGALVDIAGGLTVDTLNISAGIITVDTLGGGSVGDTLLVNTALNWNGNAQMQGGGSGILELAIGASASTAGGASEFSALTVNNNGTFVNAQAVVNDFRLENAAVFNNFGSFEVLNAVNIFSLTANATFNNNGGTFITNGNTDVFLGINFVNTGGTVDIQGGILSLNGGVAPLLLDGGSLLTGVGTFNGNVVNNGGTVEPGGVGTVGTLSITGDFTNSAGTVVIDIDNAVTLPGTDYDQLAVSNQADFGGTLQLNVVGAYTVANNDTLDPIAYATWGGNPFATLAPIGGETITPVYIAPDLTLTLSFAGLFTWTGLGANDFWNDPANWDQGVPGIGNDVLIPVGSGFIVDIAAAASAASLSLGADASLNLTGASLTIANTSSLDGSVDLSGGTLDVNGTTLTLAGGLTWSNTSTIANGTYNLPAGALLDITGGAANTLDNATMNLADASYSGGNLTLANGSALNVNGVFDFAGDVGIVDGGGATSTFNSFNGATIVKSAGAANSFVDSTVNSSHAGSVVVQTGNLDLNLALLDLGVGDVFSGAGNYIGNVAVNGGTVRPGGAGAVNTLSVTGDYTHNSGTLEIDILAAATFDVLAVSNNGNFAGGAIDVNLLGYIPSTADLQPVVTCGGTCSGAFGNITSPAGVVYAQVTNANDLTLDVLSVTFAWDGGGDGVTWGDDLNWSLDVRPDSTIDVVLPNVNVIIDADAFANSLTLNGNLNIQAGTLTIEDSITDLLVNAGGSLTVNGGTLTNLGGATFNGGFTLASGSAAFTGNASFNGAFDASGGTLNLVGGGTLQNANNNWRGGTITGGAPLVLGLTPADGSTLALTGAADKTLDTITLDMNQNDIFQSGAGNLVLANNAVVDNTAGTTYTHVGGSGGIVGVGQFNNTDGTYNHLGGTSPISVDFVNTVNSIVNVAAGSLVLQDNDAGDLATYNIAGGGTFRVDADRTFGDGSTGGVINSSGTVRVSNGTATMQLLSGEFITRNLVLDPTGALAGDPVTVLSNFFWGTVSPLLGLPLPGQLTTAPGSTTRISAPSVVLPATSNIQGSVILDNPAGVVLDLNGNTLLLNNATLSGAGNVIGNVDNVNGVVVPGGVGKLDDLQITGNYSQGSNSALVVEVFNNGLTTISEQFIVTGQSNLNGTLVIAFTTNSLGIVTSNFNPFVLGSVNGRFNRVIDAGGNILFINFTGNGFTIVGVSPKIPDAVIGELISFVRESEELSEKAASNRSEADGVMQELLKEEKEEGSLSCNI